MSATLSARSASFRSLDFSSPLPFSKHQPTVSSRREGEGVNKMNTLNIALFLVGSFVILMLSWRSLKVPGYHGFYRFFTFECCLALVIINRRFWFKDPFSPFQIISWILLFLSIITVTSSVVFLVRAGKPDFHKTDTPELGFEKTTHLVTSGIYKLIRHPMYASLLLLAWGAFFKHPSWEGIIFSGLASIFTNWTALVEETENKGKFGDAYAEYMQKTKRFIPFLY
jgi:protein-S-isoprenylcysteine O-methyltransferase Ste14